MGSLGCCVIWFLVGALLGWLFNYWLCKRCCKKSKNTVSPPTAKVADTPVTNATAVKKAPAATKENPKKTVPKTTSVQPKATSATKEVVDLAAAKAAGISIKNIDDLTVIEGIGPKINALFKDNGLKSFADVGNATVSQMRTILDKGGARYRMANPSTWAEQAKLAANNKWAELKQLQNELSGGKKK